MTDLDVARRRLRAQGLVGSGFASAAAAVRFLGAVQSQDYAAASWALGLRVPGLTAAQVDADYAAGRLLRTHVLRPTWHFVDPADLRGLLALTAPRVHATAAFYYRQAELDDVVFGRSEEVIAGALAGGGRLTRAELGERLLAAGIATDGPRLTHLMMHAELAGVICSGGLRGRAHTYALLDDLVPASALPDRDQALADLVRRYLAGHGPARVRDAAWWSGLTITEIRRGIELARGDLERELHGDVEYWTAGSATSPTGPAAPLAGRGDAAAGGLLLPNFDEYTVGYTSREEIFDVARFGAEMGRFDLLGNVLVVEGTILGRWQRTIRSRGVEVVVTPLADLKADDIGELDRVAARYGEFLGRPLTLTLL